MPALIPYDLGQFALGLASFNSSLVIASTTLKFASNAIVVPRNQRWEVSLVSLTLTTDNSALQLTANSGYMRIVTANVNQQPSQEFDIAINQVISDPTLLQIKASCLLSGMILGQGDSVTGVVHVTNSDGANDHNVTAGTFLFRYVPFLLVSEQSVVNLVQQRADFNLDPRLRQR